MALFTDLTILNVFAGLNQRVLKKIYLEENREFTRVKQALKK